LLMAVLPWIMNGCAHPNSSEPGDNDRQVMVMIEPEKPLGYDLRMGVFDFIHSTEIKGLGTDLANQAYQEFLLKRFVRVVDRIESDVLTCDESIASGKEQGYDLIVFGEITEFLYGGLSADSQVSVSMKVIDLRDKSTLWFLTGSRSDKSTGFLDFVLVWRESEEAESPYVLSRELVRKMVETIADSRYFQTTEGKGELVNEEMEN
ncbi:MAG TPA: hypothetical protein PLG17_06415, partial [Thermodesulfobacteriota bacterium]|nr:hypothetical protein [Thermodesulfobacteriota bacterium]